MAMTRLWKERAPGGAEVGGSGRESDSCLHNLVDRNRAELS